MSTKKYIYINTAPRANTKKDGSIFYTTLVGVSKETLRDNNVEHVDTLSMQVFENQLEKITTFFNLAKKAGAKLVLSCDSIIVTEPKPNTYISKTGETVTQMQASCWADGPAELTVLRNTLTISDELQALLEQDGSDDDELS